MRAAQLSIKATVDLAEAYKVPFRPSKGSTDYPCATRGPGLIRVCDVQARSAMEAVELFMNKVPKERALGGINPRQASPLWVRPIQIGPSKYNLLCVVLASNFDGSDYNWIRQFLEGKFSGQYMRVKGWNA